MYPYATTGMVYIAVVYNYTYVKYVLCQIFVFADPLHQSEYQEHCDFLYPLNSADTPDYKTNFQQLENLVLIGGPDDGVITPWQSSHFGFYDDKLNVQSFRKQGFYISDSFGLKTLDTEGRVHVYEVPGVQHLHWHGNKTVFDNYIEPWLK
jgi:palmitoyl-protein thioesterase